MFKIPVVKNCPVTRASQGRVTLPPWLIADIVGTLDREKGEEWLIFLHGTRSEDGLEVTIDSISVPEDQERHSTEVDIGEHTFGDDVVGVLHSHHSMSAKFSHTDNTKLNPRFAFSIVVSENLTDDEATWLGFSYQAEGRVTLPCGAIGVVPFVIQPEGVEDWPLSTGPIKLEGLSSEPLGDCCNLETFPDGYYYHIQEGKCGQTGQRRHKTESVFGRGTDELSKLLPPPVRQWNWQGGGWQGHSREPAEPQLADKTYDKMVRCDNCGFYEDIDDLDYIDRQLLCERCVEWYCREMLVEDRGGLLASGLSPLEEAALWEERLAEVVAREGGIYD